MNFFNVRYLLIQVLIDFHWWGGGGNLLLLTFVSSLCTSVRCFLGFVLLAMCVFVCVCVFVCAFYNFASV